MAALILAHVAGTLMTASFVAPPAQRHDYPPFAPLLVSNNGTAVTTAGEWNQFRRNEVRVGLETSILGAWPPKEQRPKLTGATLLNTTTYTSGSTSKFYHLEFLALKQHISFQIEVLEPISGATINAKVNGAKPQSLPALFMTQWNHREWALLGLSRGYVSVVYPGADTRDAAPTLQAAFPEATMMLISARALVASLTLDFLMSGNSAGQQLDVAKFNSSQVMCIFIFCFLGANVYFWVYDGCFSFELHFLQI